MSMTKTIKVRAAKATKSDLDSVYQLRRLLGAIEDGLFPRVGNDTDWSDFDERSRENLERFHAMAMEAFNEGALSRVLLAAEALLNPKNQLIDPDKDYLDEHPRIAALNESGVSTEKWFCYDPEGDGLSMLESEEAAMALAKSVIGEYMDDGWDDTVEQVCVGKVTAIATQTNVETRPDNVGEDGCDEDGKYWGEWEYTCNYELLPPSQTTPSATGDDSEEETHS